MSQQTVNTGVSLPTLLFVIFLVLKLTDNITWSWIWVTSPLWISLGAALGIIALVFTVYGLWFLFRTRPKRPF